MRDIFILAAVVIIVVPWIIISLLVRRALFENEIPFREDLRRSMLRSMLRG